MQLSKFKLKAIAMSIGTTEYNLALGERRAGSVKDYLIGKGVPSAQLSTISYGEERPSAKWIWRKRLGEKIVVQSLFLLESKTFNLQRRS